MADNQNQAVEMRRRQLEERIANMRARTMNDLDAIAADFDRDMHPWLQTFSFLEAMNEPDERNKRDFMTKYEENKDIRQGIISAMESMERDMRRSHEEFEAHIREHGEPTQGQTNLQVTLNLGDYYELPDV